MKASRFIRSIACGIFARVGTLFVLGAVIFALSGCTTDNNVIQSPEGQEPMIRVDSSAPNILPPSAN